MRKFLICLILLGAQMVSGTVESTEKQQAVDIILVPLSPERYAQNHTLIEYTFGFKSKALKTNFCTNCLFNQISDGSIPQTITDHYHFNEFWKRQFDYTRNKLKDQHENFEIFLFTAQDILPALLLDDQTHFFRLIKKYPKWNLTQTTKMIFLEIHNQQMIKIFDQKGTRQKLKQIMEFFDLEKIVIFSKYLKSQAVSQTEHLRKISIEDSDIQIIFIQETEASVLLKSELQKYVNGEVTQEQICEKISIDESTTIFLYEPEIYFSQEISKTLSKLEQIFSFLASDNCTTIKSAKISLVSTYESEYLQEIEISDQQNLENENGTTNEIQYTLDQLQMNYHQLEWVDERITSSEQKKKFEEVKFLNEIRESIRANIYNDSNFLNTPSIFTEYGEQLEDLLVQKASSYYERFYDEEISNITILRNVSSIISLLQILPVHIKDPISLLIDIHAQHKSNYNEIRILLPNFNQSCDIISSDNTKIQIDLKENSDFNEVIFSMKLFNRHNIFKIFCSWNKDKIYSVKKYEAQLVNNQHFQLKGTDILLSKQGIKITNSFEISIESDGNVNITKGDNFLKIQQSEDKFSTEIGIKKVENQIILEFEVINNQETDAKIFLNYINKFFNLEDDSKIQFYQITTEQQIFNSIDKLPSTIQLSKTNYFEVTYQVQNINEPIQKIGISLLLNNKNSYLKFQDLDENKLVVYQDKSKSLQLAIQAINYENSFDLESNLQLNLEPEDKFILIGKSQHYNYFNYINPCLHKGISFLKHFEVNVDPQGPRKVGITMKSNSLTEQLVTFHDKNKDSHFLHCILEMSSPPKISKIKNYKNGKLELIEDGAFLFKKGDMIKYFEIYFE